MRSTARLAKYQPLHNIAHAKDEKNAAGIRTANIHQESNEGPSGVSERAS